MKWFLYNIVFGLVYMLLLPKFVFRMLRRGGYAKHFLQRIGMYSDELQAKLGDGGWIWVHAVSVGEMGVAMRVMHELRVHDAGIRYFVSTNTSTAYALAEKKLPKEDVLVYFPLDARPVLRRIADRVKPRMLLLTECELWPNLIREMHSRKVPVVLFNGRLSDSSFKGYRAIRFFFRDVVALVDMALMQSEDDAKRLIELGADPDRVFVEGTMKYDMSSADRAGGDAARAALRLTGYKDDGLVIVGGSTWAGEEEVLARIFGRLKPDHRGLKLVLVPRHAERRGEVAAILDAAGLSYVKKTDIDAGTACEKEVDVLLVDTTGELTGFYSVADIVFVGKSLAQHGGQNFIEPAMFAKPVVVGPNLENFLSTADEFLSAGAMVQVKDADGLEKELRALLKDDSRRRALGGRAGELVRMKSGASKRTAERVMLLMK